MSRTDEIRERLGKATPGRMETSREYHGTGVRVPGGPTVAWCGVATSSGSDGTKRIDADESYANATLIANAPSDLSWLLERNAKLESSLRELLRVVDDHDVMEDHESWKDILNAAQDAKELLEVE